MYCLIDPGPDFGTQIFLGDDTSQLINFTGMFTFPFYGNNYTSVYINSNGNLTFNGPSTDFSPTFPEFIGGLPRIAPFWVDLNPPNAPVNGGIFYKQLSDKFIVTWIEIPYFGAGIAPYNTFQVVLYSSGQVVFAYNHLDNTTLINTTRFALVGVAAGGNNNSCVFKYDPPENFDPLETVDGPTGELDGKQLFFDFNELECSLSIRSCARGVFVTTA